MFAQARAQRTSRIAVRYGRAIVAVIALISVVGTRA